MMLRPLLLHYRLNLSRPETICQPQNQINHCTPHNTFLNVDPTSSKLKHKVTLVLCIKLWCPDKGFSLCLYYFGTLIADKTELNSLQFTWYKVSL